MEQFEQRSIYCPPLAGAGCSVWRKKQEGVDKKLNRITERTSERGNSSLIVVIQLINK